MRLHGDAAAEAAVVERSSVGLLAVRLAQQCVEAVVETGAQAGVSGVAGVGVRQDLVVPARRRVHAAGTPLVSDAGLEVAVLQGVEQRRRVAVSWTVAVQAAGATVAGDLDTVAGRKTPNTSFTPPSQLQQVTKDTLVLQLIFQVCGST